MGMELIAPRVRYAAAMFAVAAALLIGACSKQEMAAESAAEAAAPAVAGDGYSPAEPPVAGGVNRNGSLLAYEHHVQLRLPADKIAGNLAKVREACMGQGLGQCNVLNENLSAGESPSGSLQVRAEPKAVPALVKLAAVGGEISQRSTTAEDLADAVRDNGLRTTRLKLQHQKLSEIVARRDIKVEDLIALTDRLSQLETELQFAEQEAAQQKRRIQTNLLTLSFNSSNITVQSSEIGQSIRGLGGMLDSSTAAIITLLGALLPVVLLAGVAWFVIRRVRRKRA